METTVVRYTLDGEVGSCSVCGNDFDPGPAIVQTVDDGYTGDLCVDCWLRRDAFEVLALDALHWGLLPTLENIEGAAKLLWSPN